MFPVDVTSVIIKKRLAKLESTYDDDDDDSY